MVVSVFPFQYAGVRFDCSFGNRQGNVGTIRFKFQNRVDCGVLQRICDAFGHAHVKWERDMGTCPAAQVEWMGTSGGREMERLVDAQVQGTADGQTDRLDSDSDSDRHTHTDRQTDS